MAINEKITAIRTALEALGVGKKGDKVSVEKNHDALGRVFVTASALEYSISAAAPLLPNGVKSKEHYGIGRALLGIF